METDFSFIYRENINHTWGCIERSSAQIGHEYRQVLLYWRFCAFYCSTIFYLCLECQEESDCSFKSHDVGIEMKGSYI
jgi:hypothetical protein